MTAKEKKRILARSANILRQKISAADNDAFTPALATSKARPWEAQYGEYCIAIGTIAYPSFALLGLWIAEYGEAGRPDGSSTRCWLGLEFSSWQSAKEFTARVLTLKPVQYYGGT